MYTLFVFQYCFVVLTIFVSNFVMCDLIVNSFMVCFMYTHLNMLLQVLGLLIEVLKKGFYRHVNSILPVTRCILQSSIDVITDRKVDLAESIIPHWKEAYYSLVMLEKLIHQFHELCFAGDLEVNPSSTIF